MGEVLTEDAMKLVNGLAQELGLLVTDTAGFHKLVSSATKHYIYIQKSRKLGVINCSLDVPKDEPGTKPLTKDNGSVRFQIVPELEHLERFLRLLSDPATPPFKAAKNRPFAVTKPPALRQPRPVAAPVPLSAIPAAAPGGFEADPEDPRPERLQARIHLIKQQSRAARVRRWMEEGFDQRTAEMIAGGLLEPDDAREHLRAQRAAEGRSDSAEGVALEAGIELPSAEEIQ